MGDKKRVIQLQPGLRLKHLLQEHYIGFMHAPDRNFCRNRPEANEEQKINVGGGVYINYLKAGNGPNSLLLIPGTMGTIWSDYEKQIKSFDKSQYTMVIMEQPGYGKSRPPDRDFSSDMIHRDADWAARLMQELHFQKYSIMGWSFGGLTGMIMAARYPERIQKLVAWGAIAYISKAEMRTYEYILDINNISPLMKNRYLNYYGTEYFQRCWRKLYDAMLRIYKEQQGELCSQSLLNRIYCPTLILHSIDDAMLAPEHPTYLRKHIKNSRLHIIEGGKHNFHELCAQEFNRIVDEFLRRSE